MADDLMARIQCRADDPRTRTDNADIALTPRYPPATQDELMRAEARLGFRLPAFLGKVYMGVGNGGFGPGYGLIGLPGGYLNDGESIIDLYQSRHVISPNDPDWKWPDGVVPVCDWGCAIFSCVDYYSGVVVTFDPAPLETGIPMSLAFAESHTSVYAWLDEWANGMRLWGKTYEHDPDEDGPGTNPFTGKPIVYRKLRLRRQSQE
jgi:hypothetical protein